MDTAKQNQEPLMDLERELVCFICTEILYQPLTLIDCLHTFCGSCLKEWFSHQYRKALSSHRSSDGNPYTCPTCRAEVKDARRNAMVNTYLEMFVKANPTRDRPEEDKKEMAAHYKPGEKIMPKPANAKKREQRHRRDHLSREARERQMIEEARERSLRDMHMDSGSTTSDRLQPLIPPRERQTSRDRERDERRERRRAEERRRRAEASLSPAQTPPGESIDEEQDDVLSALPHPASPRHPDAVEARQREQTVVHQASLVSLISSSEGGSGIATGDSLNEARIMQEILSEGLLDGIDVDSLTEAEQDVWAERIAEAYRQRRRAAQAPAHHSNSRVPDVVVDDASDSRSTRADLHVETSHRPRNGSFRRGRAETMPLPSPDEPHFDRPRSARTNPVDNASSMPPSAMPTSQRRRRSSQGSEASSIRERSRQPSPATQSVRPASRSNVDISQTLDLLGPNAAVRTRRASSHQNAVNEPQDSLQSSQLSPTTNTIHGISSRASGTPFGNQSGISALRAELADTSISNPRRHRSETTPPAGNSCSESAFPTRQFDEPSVRCYRCHRADIQYGVYMHCGRCEVDICRRCYRTGRGCRYWYGFGHTAMRKFESENSDRRDTEQVELPHMLVGRSRQRPEPDTILATKLGKDGTTKIPLTTMSDPLAREQEGHFCDRCGSIANEQFWMCDFCNDGEWGFCKSCVDTHHCCTHPLLPVTQATTASNAMSYNAGPPSQDSNGLSVAHARPSAASSRPSSARSAISAVTGPLVGYNVLIISTNCDICHQSIAPAQHRYHCPSHPTPTLANENAHGDYDICFTCYHSLVKSNRVKRDDGPAGWRKCPNGHRMIVTFFEPDNEGQNRRFVEHDLVGGWKLTDQDMINWIAALQQKRDQTGHDSPMSPIGNPLESRGEWSWREDASSSRRATRARGVSSPPPSPGFAQPSQVGPRSSNNTSLQSAAASRSKFPPDGGFGGRGVAWWSYYPEDCEDGKDELMFPRCAEIREIENINDEWRHGVYAGDEGLWPAPYVQLCE